MSNRFTSLRFPVGLLCPLLFVLSTAGCGEDTPTSPTPTQPTIVTDVFSGTITKNGAATHRFTTASGGELSATLTALSPDDTLVVGLAVGIWNGSVCNVMLVRDEAVKSTVIYGTVNATGELCVRIYDVGRIAESTDYEITVAHP